MAEPASLDVQLLHVMSAVAPAALASAAQCRSAPARPPRSAPLPEPTQVTKNVILFCRAIAGAVRAASNAMPANILKPLFIVPSLVAVRPRQSDVWRNAEGKRGNWRADKQIRE